MSIEVSTSTRSVCTTKSCAMRKVLQSEFFNRQVVTVARELLGKFLVRTQEGTTTTHMITETEAYDGPKDKACHAYKGRTTRTEPMFDEPATIYVYFTYGMHYMLNIVTGPKEYAAAVLVRGVEGIEGPGRLTKALHINKTLNHQLLSKKTGLWVEDRGIVIPKKVILKTPRIGIDYAGEWKEKPYRFVIKKARGSQSLSL